MASSSAVNRPTDVKQKERDINQKLQLFGIYSAFANGKAPSNKQIDIALNSALASKALSSPSTRLSGEGRQLVGDLRDVIEKAKVLLLTKNEGNLLQDFIWQTQQISGGDAVLPNAPVDKDTAKQHGNQALDGLRTLGTLILSNGQFRKLLSDATILLRDMAGDAAQSAANRVNPSQDQLAQIDRPADDNTWHDVPDLSAGNLRAQAKNAIDKNAPFSRNDVRDAAGDAAQAAHPEGSRDPADVANLAARDQQNGTSSGLDAQGGVQAGIDSLDAKADIDPQAKERAKGLQNNARLTAKNYLSKKMPQDRREQTIWRLKKMVVEIQGHQDYQQAIETLLTLAETYGGHSQNLTQQSVGTVQGAHTDNALTQAETDLRTLIERFANSTSSEDLFESINNIYRDADQDPELKKWFKHADTYVRRCLQEPGFIMQDAATDEWNRLYDQGNYFFRDRYRDHTQRIIDEFKFLGDQFDQDPQNRAFAQSLNKLFNDLGNDENGKPTFKRHLVKDLTDVILPAIFENVRYVPVPRIEYSDPTIDTIVENLVIESDNLVPNSLEIQSDNSYTWGRKTVTSRRKNKAIVGVSGIQMDLKDVSYYVKKKQGFPSITDKGVMDIYMGGTGLSFKLGLETADEKDRQHFFKINTVNVDVKNLKIKMKQSNHKTLFNIFKPLMLSVVRPAVQKAIEKQIRDSFAQADQFAYDVSQDAQRAVETAQDDPENAQNIFQNYFSAIQRKLTEGAQKTEKVAANTKVNTTMTQHGSIFKDIKLPGGISTKATEYKELAAKGDRWESPVFGIGSAAESTNIPKAAPISRKPHSTAHGAIREHPNIPSGSAMAGNSSALAGNDFAPAGNGSASAGNGSAGFGNQVSQAFDANGSQDYSLKNATNGNANLGTNAAVYTSTV